MPLRSMILSPQCFVTLCSVLYNHLELSPPFWDVPLFHWWFNPPSYTTFGAFWCLKNWKCSILSSILYKHDSKRGLRLPLSNQVPPIIQGSKVPPFSLSILHIIPWNSPNGEMDERYIWIWSTKQTGSKMQETGKISSNK